MAEANTPTRLDKLNAWLERNNALLVWQREATSLCPMVSSYLVHGVVVLVVTFKRNGGWELYIPASKSNDANLTLDEATVFIGGRCQGSRGL